MRVKTFFISIFCTIGIYAQYAPPAGQLNTTAIHKDSSIIINWANRVIDTLRGYENISSPLNLATFGSAAQAIGLAQGTSGDVISLGDNGTITLGFQYPIKNGTGDDFTVFENSFDDTFLELAFVEVSTDSLTFVRFPSVSLTSTASQVGSFGSIDATKIHNLAGKYKQGYGTPFDLEGLVDSTGINVDSINYVRIIDVIGSTNSTFASYDSQGNIINDPFPTAFPSGGFDLDAIGVINENHLLSTTEKYNQKFNVYPNPSEGSFHFFSPENGTIKVFSINGKLLSSYTYSSSTSLNFNIGENGIYIIKFSTSFQTTIKKVIVNQ